MGGGDLNLKKSWHPSTLRNIERVWKAEQKHEVEKQKIEQLQKELAEERAREEIQAYAEDQGVVKKKEERLEWMYQGPAAMVNRDEYLLGRKIDKTLELLQQQESGVEPPSEEGGRFGSIFSRNSTGTATVDLANKIREDPLFSIMKKEKEQRKSLLTNPVKMKQLQQILKSSLTKVKKNKKSKKNKKRDFSDEERHHEKRKKKKYSSCSESSDSNSEDERLVTKSSSREHHNKKSIKRSTNDVFEKTRNTKGPKESYTYRQKESDLNDRKRQKESDLNDRKRQKESDLYNRKQEKEVNLYDRKQHRSDEKRYRYDDSHKTQESYIKKSSHGSKHYEQQERNGAKETKRKMDAEKRDELLREMQENAKWREDQRKRNTKRYQAEAEKEDNFKRVDPTDFLRPMLSKAAGKGSLENRVKQKVFTIQRNHSDMDRHFARR